MRAASPTDVASTSDTTIRSTYETRDLYVAAYLLVRGLELSEIDYSQSDRYGVFVMGYDSDDIDPNELHNQWLSGHDQVSASRYADTVKRLKHAVTQRPRG